jgi:hypothetical protein
MPANLVRNSWRLREAWHLRSVQLVRVGRVEVQTIHNQLFPSLTTRCSIFIFSEWERWVPSKVPTVLMADQRSFPNFGFGLSSAEIISQLDSETVTVAHAKIPLGTLRHILNAQYVRAQLKGAGIIGTHRVRARVKGFVC